MGGRQLCCAIAAIGLIGCHAPAGYAPAPRAPAPVVRSAPSPVVVASRTAPRAVVESPAPIALVERRDAAKAGPDSFMVAGCNVECENCGGIDYDTYVRGTTDDGQVELFANHPQAGGGYSCSTDARIGDEVTLQATTSGRYEFVRWRLFGGQYAKDYCPCHNSTEPTCRIEVTTEVATSFGRAYCGAVWRLKDAPSSAKAVIAR